MLAFRVAEMHERLLLGFVDSTSDAACLLKGSLGFWSDRSQSLKSFQRQSGNELRVTESLVITTVPKELTSIFQEKPDIFVTDSGFTGKLRPISVTSAVQRDDEVVDWFGLGRDLT